MVEIAIVIIELIAFCLLVRFRYWCDMQSLKFKSEQFAARFEA